MKHSKIWMRLFWVCLAVWVGTMLYLEVLTQPLNSHLTRLDQIETEYKGLRQEGERLMQDKAALEAEVNQQTSWSSLLVSGAKAFWDGFTLGAFTQDGIFEESKRYERLSKDVSIRDARRIERAKQIITQMEGLEKEDRQLRPSANAELQRYRVCGIGRSWSFLIGVVSLIVSFVTAKKEKQPATASGGEAASE